MAASIAYYTIFSLPPLLFILVTTLSLAVGWYYGDEQGKEKASNVVQDHVARLVGNEQASEEIGHIMQSNMEAPGLGWKSLLSLVGVLFAATGVVSALQNSLNIVWRIKPDPEKSGLKDLVLKRFFSLLMILGLGLVLLASFIINAFLSSLASSVTDGSSGSHQVGAVVNFLITFGILTLIFAAVFRFMPDAQIQWNDVWVGALTTAALFTVGRIAMRIYFSYSNPGQQLGAAAGSLVIVLVWVYYSTTIILFGAEFTQALLLRKGGPSNLSRVP